MWVLLQSGCSSQQVYFIDCFARTVSAPSLQLKTTVSQEVSTSGPMKWRHSRMWSNILYVRRLTGHVVYVCMVIRRAATCDYYPVRITGREKNVSYPSYSFPRKLSPRGAQGSCLCYQLTAHGPLYSTLQGREVTS